jgi:hypothetical protein
LGRVRHIPITEFKRKHICAWVGDIGICMHIRIATLKPHSQV